MQGLYLMLRYDGEQLKKLAHADASEARCETVACARLPGPRMISDIETSHTIEAAQSLNQISQTLNTANADDPLRK